MSKTFPQQAPFQQDEVGFKHIETATPVVVQSDDNLKHIELGAEFQRIA